mmetsp:Transcript_14777/g.29816  ORF Transcript_14777/g.29816 Transcript_14777/m.29816 type:complete len:294 (+) Transcript_14777:1156-2037(+)
MRPPSAEGVCNRVDVEVPLLLSRVTHQLGPILLRNVRECTWHDRELHVKLHQASRHIPQERNVTLEVGLAGVDEFDEGLGAAHDVLYVSSVHVEGEAFVASRHTEALHIRQRAVAELDNVCFFTPVLQHHSESQFERTQPLCPVRIETDAQIVQPEAHVHPGNHLCVGGVGHLACREAIPEFQRSSKERIPDAWGLLLVSDLFEEICQELLCLWIVGLCVHEFVEDLHAQFVLSLLEQLLSFLQDRPRSPHHLHEQRRRVLGRQRNQSRRVAVPITQIPVHNSPAVVLHTAVV